jgi:uridine monophosphate synthetase
MKYKLIQDLYHIGAIKAGEFILKSGRPSKIYFDLRSIISYPSILKQVADAMWQKLQTFHFDVLCGVPYAAIPVATCIALEHNRPMVMVRKEKKNYGTKKYVEGVYQPNQVCVIIDDVITTGGSILETAREIESSGLVVRDAVVLVNRSENIIHSQVNVHSIFSLNEILNYLLESDFISEPEREVLSEYQIAV